MTVAEKDLDVDFASPDFIADPWPALKRLQDEAPVFWSTNQNAWLITRHSDVEDAFADRRLSSARILQVLNRVPGGLPAEQYPMINWYMPAWVAFSDGSVHTRVRKLLVKAFSRKIVEETRAAAVRIIDEVLSQHEGKRVEFVHEIGMVVSSRIVGALLGIPESKRESFLRWANTIAEAGTAAVLTREIIDSLERALNDLNEAIKIELEERRANPRDDLLTALTLAVDGEDRLTEAELLGSVQNIVGAGFESTAFMMTMSLIELVNRPEARAMFLMGGEERTKVLLELLRHVSLVKCQARAALEDMDWHGKHIKEGDMLFVFSGAANRDTRVWDEPEIFDAGRDNSKSMAFGPGLHHCIGHLIAKMELEEILTAILRRYPHIELHDPEPEYLPNFLFRTVKALPMTFAKSSKAA